MYTVRGMSFQFLEYQHKLSMRNCRILILVYHIFIIVPIGNSQSCSFRLTNFYFTCRSAIGNCAWTSVVIHSRNVSCTFSVSTRASIASLQNGSDRCMFCSNTQPPPAIESDIRRRACISWPCPMDTDFRARNRKCTFTFNATATVHIGLGCEQ